MIVCPLPLLFFPNYNIHVNVLQLKWGGRNQEGAGTTIGEEVEQVNSFLSRAAICPKYMSKAAKHFSCIVVSKLRPSGLNTDARPLHFRVPCIGAPLENNCLVSTFTLIRILFIII